MKILQADDDSLYKSLEVDIARARGLNLEQLGVRDQCATCHPDAKCVENKCSCKAGFLGSGQFCVPLGGECRPKLASICSTNAVCHELLGANSICTCKASDKIDTKIKKFLARWKFLTK